eukprot:scaffold2448_cov250-Pinguiococcus_pyrenoidosus.AAC.7
MIAIAAAAAAHYVPVSITADPCRASRSPNKSARGWAPEFTPSSEHHIGRSLATSGPVLSHTSTTCV